MTVPPHLTGYPCADYFDSEYARNGYWDANSFLWVIVPFTEVEELPGRGFLVVGRPGVDGILFGYRAGRPGLWAFYPIEEAFHPLAATVSELARKWGDGGITL